MLFYYYHPPYVYNIHPKIGPVTGHTNVTITGSNFEDTGYVMCQFGDKLSIGEYDESIAITPTCLISNNFLLISLST